MKLELLAMNGAEQLRFHIVAARHVHACFEEAELATPVGFGGVERHIGCMHQRCPRAAVKGSAGHPDACANFNGATFNHKGLRNGLYDARGQFSTFDLAAEFHPLHQGKFVATQSRKNIPWRKQGGNPLGSHDQDAIAHRVAIVSLTGLNRSRSISMILIGEPD